MSPDRARKILFVGVAVVAVALSPSLLRSDALVITRAMLATMNPNRGAIGSSGS